MENPADIDTHLMIGSGEARSITDQPTSHDVFTPLEDCRDRVMGRQRNKFVSPAEKERTVPYEASLQRAAGSNPRRPSRFQPPCLPTAPASATQASWPLLALSPLQLRSRIFRIDQKGDRPRIGRQFVQQLKPLRR